MENLTQLLESVERFCASQGIAVSTFCNRVLGDTYAVDRMIEAEKAYNRKRAALVEAMWRADEGKSAFKAKPASMQFTLPIPTSTNKLHTGNGADKRRTKGYSDWLKVAKLTIMTQRLNNPIRQLPAGWYVARVYVPLADPGDIDNRTKALFDALKTMRVTPDDKWLFGHITYRSSMVPEGMCRVWVKSISSRPMRMRPPPFFVGDSREED